MYGDSPAARVPRLFALPENAGGGRPGKDGSPPSDRAAARDLVLRGSSAARCTFSRSSWSLWLLSSRSPHLSSSVLFSCLSARPASLKNANRAQHQIVSAIQHRISLGTK